MNLSNTLLNRLRFTNAMDDADAEAPGSTMRTSNCPLLRLYMQVMSVECWRGSAEVRGAPRVTVVVPAHNRAGLIERALRSIQAQDDPAWEAVVVDDGSTDTTAQVVERIAGEDGRIRLMRLESNRGAQAARNAGIRIACGEWIAFLDSDDEWLPSSLSIRMEAARRTGALVVHSDCLIGRGPARQSPRMLVPPFHGNVYADLLRRPGPLFQALLVRKQCLHRIGGLDEAIRAYQEWDTAIRLARRFPFAFVPEPTFTYHCDDRSAMSRQPALTALGYEQVVSKHRTEILKTAGPEALASHFRTLARLNVYAGSRIRMIRFLLLAATLQPSLLTRLADRRSPGSAVFRSGGDRKSAYQKRFWWLAPFEK